jgi:glycosyltransferase involved in cell wall biosynthesis
MTVAESPTTSSAIAREVKRISIVAPMLNEARFVGNLLADIAAQDFAGDIQLLVADGGSTDGSCELLQAGAAVRGLQLELIENPSRLVSSGLNECIKRADGDLVVRLDCHARYPGNYLRLCAETAEETDALNVGGVVKPVGKTPMERAVSTAMSSAFGGIGWTRHAGGAQRIEVDTVTYGAFRPEAFVIAGMFDPTLVRNQDDEFNLRLRRAGGRIILDPRIEVGYTPRGSWGAVFRQYYGYGFWKVSVMRKHGRILSLRSLAPAGMLASLLGLAATAAIVPVAGALLGVEVMLYALAAIVSAAHAARTRGETMSLAVRTAFVFPAFHLGYGSGMLVGMARALSRTT